MKLHILFIISYIALTSAAPQGKDEEIAIISQHSSSEPDGSYNYNYETANGIKGEETGTLKKASDPESTDVIVAQGSFSYTAPDGTVITLSYSADDEHGFAPTGDHLPTSPPIPPEIQKALDYLASLPPAKP